MAPSGDKAPRQLAVNRKARHEYFILERVEAGIALRGTEVKSIREGEASLAGAFAKIEGGQAVLYGMNVPPYAHGNRFNHVPDRPRRLLLHRREIDKLRAHVEQAGLALVPLAVYLKRGFVKVEVAVCRGKRQYDKRETLRRESARREADRAVARRG